MNLNSPFETFEHSAFRLEALPRYIVPKEKTSFEYFQKTGLIIESDPGWVEIVQRNIGLGKKMERLRLLSEYLTDYERFEIQAYQGPSAGEVIKTALKKDYIDKYQGDFWFFDDKWIAQMNYELDGTFTGFDIRKANSKEKDMFDYWRGILETSKLLRQIPFFANTPDDTHCLQAAYMSIAKYFDPSFSIPMDEWSTLTGYEEGLGTWANAGLVWFKEHGYDVKHYSLFDFRQFIKQPKEYMISSSNKEVGIWGYEHTNVSAEIARMKRLLDLDIIESKEPTVDDIKVFIDKGYLIRVTVNCRTLDDKDGYEGHAVVITDYNDTFIQFHDPGLPAIPNRQVSYEKFEAAWSDQDKELDAIKLV